MPLSLTCHEWLCCMKDSVAEVTSERTVCFVSALSLQEALEALLAHQRVFREEHYRDYTGTIVEYRVLSIQQFDGPIEESLLEKFGVDVLIGVYPFINKLRGSQ